MRRDLSNAPVHIGLLGKDNESYFCVGGDRPVSGEAKFDKYLDFMFWNAGNTDGTVDMLILSHSSIEEYGI